MAFVYMKNEDDALEVFQETLYKAFESISTLENNDYFSTWITRILINTAIALLNKKQKVVPMSNDMFGNRGDAAEDLKQEDQLDLLQAMDEIEEKYKTVLLLRFYQDYTVQQIAVFLNCPEGTVKTNIRRGLTMLKKKMKGVYLSICCCCIRFVNRFGGCLTCHGEHCFTNSNYPLDFQRIRGSWVETDE